jgi:hypothetical protein
MAGISRSRKGATPAVSLPSEPTLPLRSKMNDTQLMDALDDWFEMERPRSKVRRLVIERPPVRKGDRYNPLVRVGNGSLEVSVRIALRTWIERRVKRNSRQQSSVAVERV